MAMVGYCISCGEEFKKYTKRQVICSTCREIITARYKKARADYDQMGKTPDTCVICGRTKENKKHRYTCCSACARILESLNSYIHKREDEQAVKGAHKKIALPKPPGRRKKRIKLDDDAWTAKRLDISYGWYMAEKDELAMHFEKALAAGLTYCEYITKEGAQGV